MSDFVVLVVAKAPVAGLAKTRLCPPLTPGGAADLAAAALLDTAHLAHAAVGGDSRRVILSLSGSLDDAARAQQIRASFDGCHVVPQAGSTFAERLGRAHRDAAIHGQGRPVIQIGMDTPHAAAAHLGQAAEQLSSGACTGVLGDAADGGWWLLGLVDPGQAKALELIPMSRTDTGRRTREALLASGVRLGSSHTLRDVDTWEDALAVSAAHPHTLFAEAVRWSSRHPSSTGAR